MGLPKLGQRHWRLPSAGNAKLNPMSLSEASGWIATPEFNSHKSASSHLCHVRHADFHRGDGLRSCHNNCHNGGDRQAKQRNYGTTQTHNNQAHLPPGGEGEAERKR